MTKPYETLWQTLLSVVSVANIYTRFRNFLKERVNLNIIETFTQTPGTTTGAIAVFVAIRSAARLLQVPCSTKETRWWTCWFEPVPSPRSCGQMYKLDQAPLPTWTTPLDPVELSWQHSSALSEPSHLPASTEIPVSLQASSRPADINWSESIAARGERTQVGSTAQPDRIWEPVSCAPSDFREEVNLFSAGVAPHLEPAKHEFAQSAPVSSGFLAAREKHGKIRRGVSALSRTRSQPHTSEQKQANARESQKRFRMRQKV